MKLSSWLRSVVGLARAETRGALPMWIVLCLAGAAVLVLARWLIEVTPQSLLKEPTHAWWVLAWAGTIPLCAELFAGGGRSVPAQALRPLVVGTSAYLVAKLLVLALGASLLWVWIGAVDLGLDTQMARTKVLAGGGEAATRLLLGSAALALTTTALLAATVRSALAATVVGLGVQAGLGVVLLAPDWSSSYGGVPGFAAVVRTTVHYALHPVVLCLGVFAAGWCVSLRGAAKADTLRGLVGRALGGFVFVGLASAAAWGMATWETSRFEVLDFEDEDAFVGDVWASPDGESLVVNLHMGQRRYREAKDNECISSAWIVGTQHGRARPVVTPEEVALQVPFAPASTSASGWAPNGDGIWLTVHGRVPAITRSGYFVSGGPKAGLLFGEQYGPHTDVLYHTSEEFAEALRILLSRAKPAMAKEVQGLGLRRLHTVKGNAGILFGATADERVFRIDGPAGTCVELDCFDVERKEHRNFCVDRSGRWLSIPEWKPGRVSRLVDTQSGEVIALPLGWHMQTWRSDLIVRDGRLLVTGVLRQGETEQSKERGWLKDGAIVPAQEWIGHDRVIDLDGDRWVSVDRASGTILLLDRTGQVLRVLRSPSPPGETGS